MYCDWPVLTRCCFCMPLRQGVLVFGYLNILFSGFMIGLYSYTTLDGRRSELVYHGTTADIPADFCIVIYSLEIIFNVMLLYGAHKKVKKYVKIYYYFAISTTLASLLMGIVEVATMRHVFIVVEIVTFGTTGLILQLYLLILVSSLLKKLEVAGPNIYENQLHQFVNGEVKLESNGVYNASTIPNDPSFV